VISQFHPVADAEFEAVKRMLDEITRSEYTTSAALLPAPRPRGG
jgi:hypothetical protein